MTHTTAVSAPRVPPRAGDVPGVSPVEGLYSAVRIPAYRPEPQTQSKFLSFKQNMGLSFAEKGWK